MISLLLAAMIAGASDMGPPCGTTCEVQASMQFLKNHETRQAIDRLRPALERFPDARHLYLLLARAYMLDENLFWAERTLVDAMTKWPEDDEIRAWLGVVHLRQGDPDLASRDLEQVMQPAEEMAQRRLSLLKAAQARILDDDPALISALALLPRDSLLFPEDLPLWVSLQRSRDPWFSDVLSSTINLGFGRTSNAVAGAPTDPGVSGEPSLLTKIDIRTRLVPPVSNRFQPVIDLDILGDFINEEAYSELSSLSIAGKLGAMLVLDEIRLSLGYRPEVLYLNQDDHLYATAHRGEFELENLSGFVVFGGGGRRNYREDLRTRWEGDLGIGGALLRSKKASTIGGLTLRTHDANSQVYDLRGISAVLATRVPVGSGYAVRFVFNTSLDDYPHSGGSEGELIFGTTEKRRDLMGRISISLWTPPWHKIRPNLEVQYTDRNSTADSTPGFDFSYREWRIMAQIRWTFTADPWAPETSSPADHIPLDWGLEGDSGFDEERILDLLRHDEELRRGSSCSIP